MEMDDDDGSNCEVQHTGLDCIEIACTRSVEKKTRRSYIRVK